MNNNEGRRICNNCGDPADRMIHITDATGTGNELKDWWCLKCVYKEGKARFDADDKYLPNLQAITCQESRS
jgi:hypothetical protein